jgi:zinc protease
LKRWTSIVLLFAVGCAPRHEPPTPSTPAALATVKRAPEAVLRLPPDEPFRQVPPALSAIDASAVPDVLQEVLPNGVRFVRVPMPWAVMLVAGVASTTTEADVLDLPRGARSAAGVGAWYGPGQRPYSDVRVQVAGNLADDGSQTTHDGSRLTLEWVRGDDRDMTPLFVDAVTDSSFPQTNMKRLLQLPIPEPRQEPAWIARDVFRALAMGESCAYNRGIGRTADGPPLTRDDVLEAFYRMYQPSTTTVFMVGGEHDAAMDDRLRKAFGTWKPPAPKKRGRSPAAPALRPSATRVSVVDRPGMMQARLVFGSAVAGLPRSGYPALKVLTSLYGAWDTGVATRALREKLGASWDGAAAMNWNRDAAMLFYQGTVEPEQVGGVLQELSRQAAALRSGQVDEKSFTETREKLCINMLGAFETAMHTTNWLTFFLASGHPPEELEAIPGRILTTSQAEVQSMANVMFDESKLRVVVVGDWSTLEPELRSLGWGDVEVRDAQGKIVRVERAK